jgi:hypothetical protein
VLYKFEIDPTTDLSYFDATTKIIEEGELSSHWQPEIKFELKQ